MSTSGSKSNEHMAHFLVDIHNIVSGFAKEASIHKSIEIVKKKLKLDM